MNFDDIVKDTNVDANDIARQEGFKALARTYIWAKEGFISEGIDPLEAHSLAFAVYMDYLTGKA